MRVAKNSQRRRKEEEEEEEEIEEEEEKEEAAAAEEEPLLQNVADLYCLSAAMKMRVEALANGPNHGLYIINTERGGGRGWGRAWLSGCDVVCRRAGREFDSRALLRKRVFEKNNFQ
jgi:hypothetical protein